MSSIMPPRACVMLPQERLRRDQPCSKKEEVKGKVDRIAGHIAMATNLEEAGEALVKFGKGVYEGVTSTTVASTSLFNRIFTAVSLPFSFLSGAVSAYFMGKDAVAIGRAYAKKDSEMLQERSLNLVSNAGSTAGAGVGGTTAVFKVQSAFAATASAAKDAAAHASALAPAAAGLSVGVYTVFSAIQAFAVDRIRRTIAAVKGIFQPKTLLEKQTSDLKKYKLAMKDICDRTMITESEDHKIKVKTGDFEYGEAYSKERASLLNKKRKQLVRRIGPKSAELMFSKAKKLSLLLESSDLETRVSALKESEALFKTYKCALYKKMAIHGLRLSAGILGMIGSAIAFANPVGAGIVVGASLGVLIYSYFADRKWKESSFKNGLRVGKKVVSDYSIPSADKIIGKEREVEHLKRLEEERIAHKKKRERKPSRKVVFLDPVRFGNVSHWVDALSAQRAIS